MKQAHKEAFENNMYHHGTMKTIAKSFLSNRQCSVQEAVYHILPVLKLRRIFPAVYFVNTNPLEERVQVLLSEKNEVNFQTIAKTFLRNLILIAIWKDQVQDSALENTVYKTILVT